MTRTTATSQPYGIEVGTGTGERELVSEFVRDPLFGVQDRFEPETARVADLFTSLRGLSAIATTVDTLSR